MGVGGCFDGITESYIPLNPPSRGEFKGFFIELLGVECIAKVKLNLVYSLKIKSCLSCYPV